jgi:L-ascorbate metabolism protein UlaG (beta-lactamase superfamily)
MRYLLTLPVVGLLALSCSNLASRHELTVTYVASCGFLVEADDQKMIIDGLLAGFDTDYYHLPNDSVVDLMRGAQKPFDQIDLILVTHAHRDHFDAEVTAEHMLNNPRVVLAGPPQVDEKLRATPIYPQIADRLQIIPAPSDSVVELQLPGIQIKALPSEHAPAWDVDTLTGEKTNRHARIEHLEFVVGLADRILYHCGDADLNDTERYRSFGFGDTTIDLAMVNWWDAREDLSFTQKLIHDIIRPERIIMMHMFRERPPRGEPENQILVASEVIRPEYLMQQWPLD